MGTLRVRLALALAGLAALSVVAVTAISYAATAQRLYGEVDASLRDGARLVPPPGPDALCADVAADDVPERAFFGPLAGLRGSAIQCVDADGNVTGAFGSPGFPEDTAGTDVTDRPSDVPVVDVPEREGGRPGAGYPGYHPQGSEVPASAPWTQEIGGERYRVVAIGLDGGGELRIARGLAETENVLGSLRDRSILAGLGIIALAAAVGVLLAGRITQPVRRLTDAAEGIAATGRLEGAVPAGERGGHDEIGRLARAFSAMLAALTRARDQQQRLVQDAGHELRTPLTSLRANIGTLRRHRDLAGEPRERLLADLDSELGELSGLVDELVALAVDRYDDEPEQTVWLEELAERAADRARRRSGRTIDVDGEPTEVIGKPHQLLRAVSNLLDNAVKFSPDGTPVAVTVRAGPSGGTLTVRDHGPGIATGDLPHVFERFYRALDARAQPGSGLGLAIVQQIVEGCGGNVQAGNHPQGGAVFTIELPADHPPVEANRPAGPAD